MSETMEYHVEVTTSTFVTTEACSEEDAKKQAKHEADHGFGEVQGVEVRVMFVGEVEE